MLYQLLVDAETNPKRIMIAAWDPKKELEPHTDPKFIEVGIYRSLSDLRAAMRPYISLEDSI